MTRRPALTLAERGVIHLVREGMVDARGPFDYAPKAFAAACVGQTARSIDAVAQRLILRGVLNITDDGRIYDPATLPEIDRQERRRAANAANAQIAGLTHALKAEIRRKNKAAAEPSGSPNLPQPADSLLMRIVRAIGLDLTDPDVVETWSSIAAHGYVRQWRRWGLPDDRIVEEMREAATALVDRIGPDAIRHPARFEDWMARAARDVRA